MPKYGQPRLCMRSRMSAVRVQTAQIWARGVAWQQSPAAVSSVHDIYQEKRNYVATHHSILWLSVVLSAQVWAPSWLPVLNVNATLTFPTMFGHIRSRLHTSHATPIPISPLRYEYRMACEAS